MFDRAALKITKPFVDAIAKQLAASGFTADQITFAAFALGVSASVLIAFDHPLVAIMPLLLSRVGDGVDGALARLTAPTDRGTFLDIALDFLFYASVPLAFAIADPPRNALPAALLLAAFIGTGTSFLAYAIMAAKRGQTNAQFPSKSFYYLGGLAEGTETIAMFVGMCLWPQYFPELAIIYTVLCTFTTFTRLWAGWRNFGS